MFAGNSEVEADYAARRASKTIEEIYQKVTQREHILLRPDSYVGSVEHLTEDTWVMDQEEGIMVKKKLTYVPALLKIYDEILVNAADNLVRDPTGMDRIEVVINQEERWISVYNNGRGIPIRKHATLDMYICELIFGNLLTGDNYNDNQTRCTGGRNGYGAKLTNVYSTKFIIETGDSDMKKQYRQVFEQNMEVTNLPEITAFNGESFTKVTFYPDLPRFKLTKLDEDHCALFRRRAYDIAGTTRETCKVKLDDKILPLCNFVEYIKLYVGEEPRYPIVHEKVNDRWEVSLTLGDTGSFTQVSFVNSISTHRGGSHIHHVTDPLIEAILERISKEYKGGIKITKAHVKNHLTVYVNCLIENPHFDTQTKETHTTKISQFGSKCVLTPEAIQKIADSGVVDMILEWAKGKEQADMARKLKISTRNMTKISGLPKLEDANDAGTKKSLDCTLILTEGDSAKALAVAGLAVIGRDKYGVYPLRGKMLNVRNAGLNMVVKNAEVNAILKIIGLQFGKKSEDGEDMLKDLRYGSVMIMSDQDYDGSHIKGLIINFFAHWFPTLFKREGFVKEFVTPIVKVTKGKKSKSFFTVPDYEMWREENNRGKGWKTKYYKGLGTSTNSEAKEYFSNLKNHVLDFRWEGEKDDEKVDLAFNVKRANDRKVWIDSFQEDNLIDHNEDEVTYADFIDKELVLFARYDVYRSVASLVDGLKPGQRKVLFAAFKRKLYKELKVAVFASYISEKAAYHHGEASLEGTIVTLAQDYCGSNNVKLFVPQGQFGSRLQGGKDHASSRYIYTFLNMPVARALFCHEDDKILEYQDEEGMSIEPKYYIPTIPFALVNGAEGIGTGYSTYIPPFNPRDIIENCRHWLRGEDMTPMMPWFRNFNGTITRKGPQSFQTEGICAKTSKTTLEITELPIRKWTVPYKEFLDSLMQSDTSPGIDVGLVNIEVFHTEARVHFVLELTQAGMKYCERVGFEQALRLTSSISTANMMLFDATGKVKNYKSATSIISDFAVVRLDAYERRKAYLLGAMAMSEKTMTNQTRFILMVIAKTLKIRRRKMQDIMQELKEVGFDTMTELRALGQDKDEPVDTEEKDDADEGEDKSDDEREDDEDAPVGEGLVARKEYAYLIDMPLSSLTYEKVEELKKTLRERVDARELLERTSTRDLWEADLKTLEEALDLEDKFYEEKNLKDQSGAQLPENSSSRPGAMKSAPIKKGSAKDVGAKRRIAIDLDKKKKIKVETPHAIEKKIGGAKHENSEPSAPAAKIAKKGAASVKKDGDKAATNDKSEDKKRVHSKMEDGEVSDVRKAKKGMEAPNAKAKGKKSDAKTPLQKEKLQDDIEKETPSVRKVEAQPEAGETGAELTDNLYYNLSQLEN
eukprot:GEMP01001093.1.p1 GENE.GEMP01001093.1~~GEMP01001093.1.p1  ORF type:complete len:1372 (+),score=322.59 GEMP01001093.1:171-4286(+)